MLRRIESSTVPAFHRRDADTMCCSVCRLTDMSTAELLIPYDCPEGADAECFAVFFHVVGLVYEAKTKVDLPRIPSEPGPILLLQYAACNAFTKVQ